MKKLFLLFMVMPCLSYGQKFDISELGGYSILNVTNPQHGFSNEVKFGYHPLKHFVVSALYEYDSWVSKDNSFGIAQDFVSKYFYAGIDEKMTMLGAIHNAIIGGYAMINYKPSLSYGVHAGMKQKICKRLSVIEQIGYEMLNLKGTITYKSEEPIFPANWVNGAWCGGIGVPAGPVSFSSVFKYYYCRIGISYTL